MMHTKIKTSLYTFTISLIAISMSNSAFSQYDKCVPIIKPVSICLNCHFREPAFRENFDKNNKENCKIPPLTGPEPAPGQIPNPNPPMNKITLIPPKKTVPKQNKKQPNNGDNNNNNNNNNDD